MTIREFRLTGYTTGCNIVVVCDQDTVGQHTLDAIGSTKNTVDVLASWNKSVDLSQSASQLVELEIHCLEGNLHFVDILTNMISAINEPRLIENLSWPRHEPTASELRDDITTMSNAALVEKYDLSINELRQRITWHETIAEADNFAQPYHSIDGRSNVVIAGALQSPSRDDSQGGPWHWFINSGQILTCDFVVTR